MSFAAIGISVGSGLAVGAINQALAPGQPAPPNLASSSAMLSNVNAQLLPITRGLSAAAQTGGSYTFSLPPGISPASFNDSALFTPAGGTQEQVFIPNPTGPGGKSFGPAGGGQWVNYNPADFQTGGKYANLTQPQTRTVASQNGKYTVNFGGYGTADVEGAIAKQNAADQLKLARQFDPQYIQSALSQEAQADPQSVAAKQEMSQLIQEQVNRPENSPLSDLLNSQVQDSLNAAHTNSLTAVDQARLNAAVADARAARGGASGPANFTAPLTTGFAGEQRQAGAAQAAQGFLSSGSSPEDIAYRREQQNLANLSAEANDKTPESQFGSLSGAQNGPTPMLTAAPLPTLPTGQAAGADSAAIQQWGTTMQAQQSQANPWTQGLSTLLGLGSVAGNLGYKPLAG